MLSFPPFAAVAAAVEPAAFLAAECHASLDSRLLQPPPRPSVAAPAGLLCRESVALRLYNSRH